MFFEWRQVWLYEGYQADGWEILAAWSAQCLDTSHPCWWYILSDPGITHAVPFLCMKWNSSSPDLHCFALKALQLLAIFTTPWRVSPKPIVTWHFSWSRGISGQGGTCISLPCKWQTCLRAYLWPQTQRHLANIWACQAIAPSCSHTDIQYTAGHSRFLLLHWHQSTTMGIGHAWAIEPGNRMPMLDMARYVARDQDHVRVLVNRLDRKWLLQNILDVWCICWQWGEYASTSTAGHIWLAGTGCRYICRRITDQLHITSLKLKDLIWAAGNAQHTASLNIFKPQASSLEISWRPLHLNIEMNTSVCTLPWSWEQVGSPCLNIFVPSPFYIIITVLLRAIRDLRTFFPELSTEASLRLPGRIWAGFAGPPTRLNQAVDLLNPIWLNC